jgi:hypothetical protein
MTLEDLPGGLLVQIHQNYRIQLAVIRSQDAKVSFKAMSAPVSNGRQLLFDSHRANSRHESIQKLRAARHFFDVGSIHPDEAEWPLDGSEFGRANSCMWGGITRVLLHEQSENAFEQDATKSDTWFGMGLAITLEKTQSALGGRIAQEWAESRRLKGDQEVANTLFETGSFLFTDARIPERVEPCINRRDKTGACPVDSSFFLGRPPTVKETEVLTSILGGRNTESFYRATMGN